MPLRFILKYLANNEQLVQKIADSYPVRRAAQLCISVFYRSQNLARENLPPVPKIAIRSLLDRFKKNLAEGMKEAKQQIKDSQKFPK